MSISSAPRRLAGVLLAIAAVLPAGAMAAVGPAASRPRRGPGGPAFYKPPSPLPSGPHGTPIWSRTLTDAAALPGATNRLVLYKQLGVTGRPVAVSGVVSVPRGRAPRGGWPVVSYAHGTVGIADACAPSRDSADTLVHPYIAYVDPLLERWIKAGYAVVRTDYEGLGTPGDHPYLVGRSEGYGVLDVVRAARKLDPTLGSRVVISGHSQGGHAALWAASLAPSYTPELQIRGTVAFAPQSHTATEASLLQSLPVTGLTPLAALILRGVDIADPALHIGALLTPRAAALYPQTTGTCLPQLSLPTSFGGLPLDQLVDQNANLGPAIGVITANDPDALRIVGAPVLIEQGSADTTVLPSFASGLAQELTQHGARVTYKPYSGVTHAQIVVAAAADATRFIRGRLGR